MKEEIIKLFVKYGYDLKSHFVKNDNLIISKETSDLIPYEAYMFDIIMKKRVNEDDYGYVYSLTFKQSKDQLVATIDLTKSYGEFIKDPLEIIVPTDNTIDSDIINIVNKECENLKDLLIKLVEEELETM
jgi:hypothetical protein